MGNLTPAMAEAVSMQEATPEQGSEVEGHAQMSEDSETGRPRALTPPSQASSEPQHKENKGRRTAAQRHQHARHRRTTKDHNTSAPS